MANKNTQKVKNLRTRHEAAVKVAEAAANAVKNAEKNLSEAEAEVKKAERNNNLSGLFSSNSSPNKTYNAKGIFSRPPMNSANEVRWGHNPKPSNNNGKAKRNETARRRAARISGAEGEVWAAAQRVGRNNNTYKKNRANYKSQPWLKRQFMKAGIVEGAQKPTRRPNNVKAPKRSWRGFFKNKKLIE